MIYECHYNEKQFLVEADSEFRAKSRAFEAYIYEFRKFYCKKPVDAPPKFYYEMLNN